MQQQQQFNNNNINNNNNNTNIQLDPDVAFDVFRDQVVTKEVFPKSVSDEFAQAFRRRSLGKETLDDPFAPTSSSSSQQQVFNLPPAPAVAVTAAPAVVDTNIFSPNSMAFSSAPQPSIPTSNNYTTPATAAAVTTTQQPESAEAKEAHQLVTAIKKYLKSRPAASGPCTVGDLSAQIKNITGQPWGGFWQKKHGELVTFVKSHPSVLSVVKNKYVVLCGQEDVALKLFESQQQQQQQQSHPQPALTQASQGFMDTKPISSSLNLIQQQQQQQQFQYQQPPQVPFFYDQQQQQQQLQQPYQMPPQPMFNPPTQYQPDSFFSGSPPTGVSNFLMQQQPAQLYSPIQDRGKQAHRDSSADWMAFGTAPGTFDPFGSSFDEPIAGGNTSDPFGGSNTIDWGDSDPFWNPTPSTTVPTTSFGTGMTDEERQAEEKKLRKAQRKAEKEAQKELEKQQAADEELARKLQEEEYTKAGVKDNEWVTLSVAEMRDLAEKELGRDNVRIIAGFTVRKMGREGRPHQRKMWVTASLTHLAWSSSLLDGSHRGVELRQVTDIVVGQMTHTISRSTTDKDKVRSLCFSLITSNRTLDLQACSVIQRDALVAALQQVVAFNKKYRPQKVDRYHTKVQVAAGTRLPISTASSPERAPLPPQSLSPTKKSGR